MIRERAARPGIAAGLFILPLIVCALLFGCDHLEERATGLCNNLDRGSGWNYPFHLVIGGGLSETLSVLSIKDEDSFEICNDVSKTAQSINETVAREGEIYAVCSLSNSVVVYDETDLSISREIGVGESTNPMSLTFDDNGLAWVANYLTNDVRAFDMSSGTPDGERLKAVVPMPSSDQLPADADDSGYARPDDILVIGTRLLVLCGNMNDLYVSAGPGVLAEYDTSDLSLTRIVVLSGRNPIDIEADGDRLVIAEAGTYDAVSGGFAGDGIVEILNAETLDSEAVIEMNAAPFKMIRSPWGTWYFENGARGTVLAADLENLKALAPIELPSASGPGVSFASAVEADGHGFLYAAEFNHDKLYIMDSAQDYQIVASFTVNGGPDTLLMLHGLAD
jgi:hypothetical protein